VALQLWVEIERDLVLRNQNRGHFFDRAIFEELRASGLLPIAHHLFLPAGMQ
jgi:hypothetical protein